MICPVCGGDGWLRRLVPHPGVPGKMVTTTRICPNCLGKCKVPEYQLCGKDRAANDCEDRQ
jgi:hypothetical protein